MSGSQLLFLHRGQHPGGEVAIDLVGAVADHYDRARWLQRAHRLEDPADQGPPCRHMGHLGETGFHPLPLTGGEDDDMDRQRHLSTG